MIRRPWYPLRTPRFLLHTANFHRFPTPVNPCAGQPYFRMGHDESANKEPTFSASIFYISKRRDGAGRMTPGAVDLDASTRSASYRFEDGSKGVGGPFDPGIVHVQVRDRPDPTLGERGE